MIHSGRWEEFCLTFVHLDFKLKIHALVLMYDIVFLTYGK